MVADCPSRTEDITTTLTSPVDLLFARTFASPLTVLWNRSDWCAGWVLEGAPAWTSEAEKGGDLKALTCFVERRSRPIRERPICGHEILKATFPPDSFLVKSIEEADCSLGFDANYGQEHGREIRSVDRICHCSSALSRRGPHWPSDLFQQITD